jgi:hypothetical protein
MLAWNILTARGLLGMASGRAAKVVLREAAALG